MSITLPTFQDDGKGLGYEARYGAVEPQSPGIGGEVGTAQAGFGKQLEAAGVERMQQIKQLQTADYMNSGYGGLIDQTLTSADVNKDQLKNGKLPNGQGYTDSVLGGFDQGLEQLKKNAPNPQVYRQIEGKALGFRKLLETRSRNFEAQSASADAVSNLQPLLGTYANQARNNPDLSDHLWDAAQGAINNPDLQLHPKDRDSLLKLERNHVYDEAAMGAAEKDYAGFLGEADSGKWDDRVSPEGLDRARNYAMSLKRQDDAYAKAQAAEGKRQAADQKKVDQGQEIQNLFVEHQNTVAAAEAGADTVPMPDRDRYVFAFGDKQGPVLWQKAADNVLQAQARGRLFDAPESDLLKAAAEQPPDKNAPDYGEKYVEWQKGVAAAQEVYQKRHADPVGYATQHDPAVQASWKNVYANLNDPDALKAAIGQAVSWQARMGMSPKDYRPLPAQMMNTLVGSLSSESATPQQQIGDLKATLKAIDGASYPDKDVKDQLKRNLFGELKKAGVPGVEYAEPLIKQGAPELLIAQMMSNERIKTKSSQDEQNNLKPVLDAHLQDWQYVGSTLSAWTGDASYVNDVNRLTSSIKNWAGNFGADKVGAGVSAYTAGMQPVSDENLAAGGVPQGVDTKAVMRGLTNVRGSLGDYLPKDRILAITDPTGAGGPVWKWKVDRSMAGGSDVRFRLGPDGAHLLIPAAGGYVGAYDSSHQPIVIPYDKVVSAPAPQAKDTAPLATDDLGRAIPGTGEQPAGGKVVPATPDQAAPFQPAGVPQNGVTEKVRPISSKLKANATDSDGIGGAR